MPKHIHILGICGTFMGGIAVLAKALGYRVTGSDTAVYPPMSTLLEEAGIEIISGYDAVQLEAISPDEVIVGNALSRGKPVIEALLNRSWRYTSGPEWLGRELLHNRFVLAVSGTHGKTTTSSMVAWILEYAGMKPGFLIGGAPLNFGVSARLGETPFFVIEADEYDTAFFDKRSKFMHYRPRTCIINNIEFDHADIFPTIEAIEQQFHHLVRTIPGDGQIIYPQCDQRVAAVLAQGCWSSTVAVGQASTWAAIESLPDGSAFTVTYQGESVGRLEWALLGQHNVQNALAALAAAHHAGVDPCCAVESLAQFRSVARRLEVKGRVKGVTVYDDFAHHPTAIEMTLAGLRARVGENPILAIVDIRSNTMKRGVHQATLANSLKAADCVFVHHGADLGWDLASVIVTLQQQGIVAEAFSEIEPIVVRALQQVGSQWHILVMSNGGFGGIHQKVLEGLQTCSN